MAMSTDEELLKYQPDILEYGINEYTTEHERAREDIIRKLRSQWWNKAKSSPHFEGSSLYAELDDTKLNEAQFTRCAVYLVLAEYVLPQLTKWNANGDEDKFQVMMKHYKTKFNEEFAQILLDGVDYDFDNDGTVQDNERETFQVQNRLFR